MRKWIDLFENSRVAMFGDESMYGPTGRHILYHASPIKISQFYPMCHFGTEDAAWERAVWLRENEIDIDDPLFFYKVEINIHESIEILDRHQQHSTEETLFHLASVLSLPHDEVSKVAGNTYKTMNYLKSVGIEYLWYKNAFEDVGSISFMVVDPANIKILEIETLDI